MLPRNEHFFRFAGNTTTRFHCHYEREYGNDSQRFVYSHSGCADSPSMRGINNTPIINRLHHQKPACSDILNPSRDKSNPAKNG